MRTDDNGNCPPEYMVHGAAPEMICIPPHVGGGSDGPQGPADGSESIADGYEP